MTDHHDNPNDVRRAKLAEIRGILEDDTQNDHLAIVGLLEVLEASAPPEDSRVKLTRNRVEDTLPQRGVPSLHPPAATPPKNDPQFDE